MASTIPNQPIIFDQEANCWLEDSGLKVLAKYGDITQFQMKLNPCDSDVNIIQGGNFQDASLWTLGNGWSVGSGNACHSVGLAGAISQSAPITNGTLCRMRITVEAEDGAGVTIFWGNYIGNLGDGTHEVWIEAQSTTLFAISTAGSNGVCVRDLQLITVNTDFLVNIVDDSGVVVDSLDTSDGYFDFTDGYFTCSIDWESLAIPDGCYTIQVVDPCYCSQRGMIPLDFTSGTWNWDANAGWTIGSGLATYNSSSTQLAQLFGVLCNGTEYEVTYTLDNMSGNSTFQILLGTATGTLRSSNGTYTETITAVGSSFVMRGNSLSGTQTFKVEAVSIVATETTSIVSNEIKVNEDWNCTTLNLSMCNDSDAFGFGFENTGFVPSMRIPASLVRSSYPMERLSYDNSLGRKSPYYGRSRKARELGFDGLEFMHDFAHLWLMADHFYIDGSEYFIEDDEYPSISWSEGDDVGGVTMVVSEKTQLLENRRLSSASVGCSLDGVIMTTEKGDFLVTEDKRQPLTIG